eukprot:Skav212365  [mRNA]  locus=scaffold3038:155752:165688:+ [translate_table: standard]
MGKPEPWRKTGRRAKEEHWLGLEEKVVIEASLYNDQGQQQGRGVIQLERRALEDQEAKDGQTWQGRFLAIEDDYYEWWVNHTYPGNLLPFHFCAHQVTACRVATLYREPIHLDVFRILPDNTYESLVWLKDAKKEQAKKKFDGRLLVGPGVGDVALGNPEGDGLGPGAAETGEVADGMRGIEGLAAALGQPSDAKAALAANEELRQAKRRKTEDDEKDKAKPKEGLQEALQGRKAPEPELSALKMRSDRDKKKRDKKKKKKKKEKKKSKKSKKDASGSSGSDDSESSSSSTGSLFRLAALPQGVDKLHRLHQEKPGALANLTLRRFQELLNRSVGRGAAPVDEELPAVARAYLSEERSDRESMETAIEKCKAAEEVGDLLELYCKACEEGNVTRQDWCMHYISEIRALEVELIDAATAHLLLYIEKQEANAHLQAPLEQWGLQDFDRWRLSATGHDENSSCHKSVMTSAELLLAMAG